jgi:hypothetical protein
MSANSHGPCGAHFGVVSLRQAEGMIVVAEPSSATPTTTAGPAYVDVLLDAICLTAL